MSLGAMKIALNLLELVEWDVSSEVEHLTFNQGVVGSIPTRPTEPALITTKSGDKNMSWLNEMRQAKKNIDMAMDGINQVIRSLDSVGLTLPSDKLCVVLGDLTHASAAIKSGISSKLNEDEESSRELQKSVLSAGLELAKMIDSGELKRVTPGNKKRSHRNGS